MMMGKPIVQSREELDTSIERCKMILSIADEALKTEHVKSIENVYKYVIKEPVRFIFFILIKVGTVLILSSWDFPVLSAINHMVPAVLCGNSVLLKDNPRTPTSNFICIKCFLVGKHF